MLRITNIAEIQICREASPYFQFLIEQDEANISYIFKMTLILKYLIQKAGFKVLTQRGLITHFVLRLFIYFYVSIWFSIS